MSDYPGGPGQALSSNPPDDKIVIPAPILSPVRYYRWVTWRKRGKTIGRWRIKTDWRWLLPEEINKLNEFPPLINFHLFEYEYAYRKKSGVWKKTIIGKFYYAFIPDSFNEKLATGVGERVKCGIGICLKRLASCYPRTEFSSGNLEILYVASDDGPIREVPVVPKRTA
jgi:hypothetical protein